MNLIQAIYARDSEAVHEHMKRGHHPGNYIEHSVVARHRPDLLPFILSFMSGAKSEELACIRRVQRRLEFLERYPCALAEVNLWLIAQKQST